MITKKKHHSYIYIHNIKYEVYKQTADERCVIIVYGQKNFVNLKSSEDIFDVKW